MSRTINFFGIIPGIILFLFACSGNDTGTELEVEPGLKTELVAAEPLVIDPVAYAFDETGLLYVVEDGGYPDPAEGGTPPVKEGQIAMLTDSDGDGRYDHRTGFATGFTYPNGIMPWKGGVFVTCSPDIWYLKDTTGDGQADIRQVVLTGFYDTRTSQIRMSHPTLGLDGWVYVSSGLNGGEVYSPLYPGRDTVKFSASDGRFDPDTYEFETVGGKSQFGMAFDGYGHRFGVSNRHPIMQVVIEPRYLNRNPYLPYNQTVQNVSKVGAEAVVFPLKEIVTTSDYIPNLMGRSHQGTFTAASSTYIYYGAGLSTDHQGNAFICESAQNLMQRQVLVPDGATYRSELAYQDREFLASEDDWFRPVYVNNGPDDGLYVVDMHRKVIDHPSYVPEEVRDKLDFESGKDMGRIYRIVEEDDQTDWGGKNWFSREASGDELVRRLESGLEWDRETAFRLLLEREKVGDRGNLEKIALQSESPLSRVKALWLLRHFNQLSVNVLVRAFNDKVAGIREQAILLAEPVASSEPDLKNAIISAVSDPDMHVRLQAALTLGTLQGENVIKGLTALGLQDGDDQWMREAVLSGVGERMPEFISALQSSRKSNSPAYALVMKDMGQMYGRGLPLPDCRKLSRETLIEENDPAIKQSVILGLAEGLNGRPDLKSNMSIWKLLMEGVPHKSQSKFLDELIRSAQQVNEEGESRVTALELLGYKGDTESLAILKKALDPEELPSVQQAAVRALMQNGNQEGGNILTEKDTWKGFTPMVRSRVVSSMISQPTLTPVLLKAIAKGTIAASDVPSVSRKRLMNSGNTDIKMQAETAFASLEGGDRMAIFEDYKQKLDGQGDPVHGAEVFKRACAICHTYEGAGGKVGPDLTAVKNQPREAILMHTLMPNYEVYPTYQTITIETKDGRHVAGWTVSETENSITLRTAGGEDQTVLRSSIKTLNNTGQSLMPDGLEQTMTKGEMNDLIAYLKKGSQFLN